eukprot:TRINITY_DN37115_c0_g1_i1.p1 TRINITY_DN37115_c0_g1~~TRINITY_DN37115_c0_g1_i1.p1  ORF type:complete len:240 (+),score=39.53 TRINITY_DN37115_c0_g1_i1:84-722(+)
MGFQFQRSQTLVLSAVLCILAVTSAFSMSATNTLSVSTLVTDSLTTTNLNSPVVDDLSSRLDTMELEILKLRTLIKKEHCQYVSSDGFCYVVVQENLNYTDSNTRCQELYYDGTLAIPHTTEDKDLLHGMGIALGEKNQLHLGIDDIAEEGVYRTLEGEFFYSDSLGYSSNFTMRFVSSEPTGGVEDCVGLYLNYGINDERCSNEHSFYCQF